MWWLAHALGLTSASSMPCLAWSGIVGDLGLTGALLLNAWLFARKHNCHHCRCLRLGRFAAAGGRVYCARHHGEHSEPPAPDQAAAFRKLSDDVASLSRALSGFGRADTTETTGERE